MPTSNMYIIEVKNAEPNEIYEVEYKGSRQIIPTYTRNSFIFGMCNFRDWWKNGCKSDTFNILIGKDGVFKSFKIDYSKDLGGQIIELGDRRKDETKT